MLASWVLLASALSLLAAGTLYTDAVTLAGLHRELLDTPPADRSVVVRTKILPDRIPLADDAILPQLRDVLAVTGGEIAHVYLSGPYADATADAETVTDLEVFASFEGIDHHGTLLDGHWAEPGRTPLEATVSDAAARTLGVQTGDRLELVSRLDASRTVEITITGTWRADASDPYWLDDPLTLEGSQSGGRFTTRGPLVVAGEDLTNGALSEALDAQWRAIPSLDGFRPDTLDAIAAETTGLAARINAALPGSNKATVATRLPDILASVDRSVLVTQAGILLLLVQFGVLAGYAVVLVAALLLERRRTETALLRARGAGLGHQVAMTLGEALLVSVPAAVAAPWLATLLVAAVRLNPALEGVGLETPLPGAATFTVAAVGGLVAVLALTLPTLASSVSIAGVRTAVGRQVGRTLPQRLGLDLALVLLAAIALLQLRLYGAPLTRNARGALGVDPLLVAAPAIGLLGGAVLAIRIIPRLAELAERLLARGRGLVGALGGRQLARRPLRYTRAALLLILAAALGTFASAHAATWTRSQVDQATYAAAADMRMTPGSAGAIPGWAMGSTIRGIPGVSVASPVVRASVNLGVALRDAPALGVDAATLASVIRLRDDPARATIEDGLAALAAARRAAPGVAIPDGTQRLSVELAPSFLGASAFKMPDGEPTTAVVTGASLAAYVVDGDGRIARLSGEPVSLDAGTRLVVPLAAGAGSDGATPPLHLLAARVSFDVVQLDPNTALPESIEVGSFATSADAAGDAWSSLVVPSDTWTVSPFDTFTGSSTVDARTTFVESSDVPVPALIGPAFLATTGASVGDTLSGTVVGVPVRLDLIAKADAFPPLDPSTPFVVVDGLALEVARFVAGATPAETSEWWLAVDPGAITDVAATLRAAPISARMVVSRSQALADLNGDPLGLGVIGILGLGSMAALLFAAIGFLVSSTVSTAERLGEFALLKALGLSPRQLAVWLAMESVSLLVVGLVAGTGLGLVLAWLALPFATLTASGAPPIPAPIVVVPAEAVLPTVLLAVLLVIATFLLVRRQLPAARTSAVLRARDE
jgi:FtsX-like permease family